MPYYSPSSGASVTDATISTSDITTNNVSTSKHGWTPKAPNDATKYLDGTGAYTVPAGGGGGSWPPLDQYTLDGTVGDHFTGASLDVKWTRRNFTSGAETYQAGKNATYLRISGSGRAVGDGYLQSASSDGTYALKIIMRNWGSNYLGYGIALVDSAGTGVVLSAYSNPNGMLLQTLTTYSTYGGSFKGVGGDTNPLWPDSRYQLESQPVWMYIRKSGTSCFGAVSLDGETWSTETGAATWSGTMNRAGMLISPLGSVNGSADTAIIDWDWFNKIA